MPALVSIVIPCFNYGAYLAEAIESAQVQTYPEIEILVADDGSTDDTRAVAARFGPAIVYLHQPNQGPGAARNLGAARARGEWIVFLDADDSLEPTYVEETMAVALADPSLAFVYTQMRLFGRLDRITRFPGFDARRLTRENFINVSALLRADLVRTVGFDPAFRYGWEDWDFFLGIVAHGGRGRLLDRPLIRYRKHTDETSLIDRFDAAGIGLKRRYLLRLFRKHRRLFPAADQTRFLLKYLALLVPGATRFRRLFDRGK